MLQRRGMAPVEQRVAYLEGRVEDHTALMADIRAEMRDLRSTMERGFERLDHKTDRHFMWLVGIMLTGFLSGFGAMITLFMRVLDRLP